MSAAPRGEMSRRAPGITFARLKGDCYNANPVSMRAAPEHHASLEESR